MNDLNSRFLLIELDQNLPTIVAMRWRDVYNIRIYYSLVWIDSVSWSPRPLNGSAGSVCYILRIIVLNHVYSSNWIPPIHDTTFTLHDGMTAVEMMHPQMDIGARSSHTRKILTPGRVHAWMWLIWINNVVIDLITLNRCPNCFFCIGLVVD